MTHDRQLVTFLASNFERMPSAAHRDHSAETQWKLRRSSRTSHRRTVPSAEHEASHLSSGLYLLQKEDLRPRTPWSEDMEVHLFPTRKSLFPFQSRSQLYRALHFHSSIVLLLKSHIHIPCSPDWVPNPSINAYLLFEKKRRRPRATRMSLACFYSF